MMIQKIFPVLGLFILGLFLIFIVQSMGTFTYSYRADLQQPEDISDLKVQTIKYNPPMGNDIITDGKNKTFLGKNNYSLSLNEKIDYFIASFNNVIYLALVISSMFVIIFLFLKNQIFPERRSKTAFTL